MAVQPHAGALEAVERILNREPEADEVLRQVVAALLDRIDSYSWVGISFVEEGGLVLGPSKGADGGGPRLEAPVVYNGMHVATLAVVTEASSAEHDQAFLDRVATLISAHCLVGWDTGGEPWAEDSPKTAAE
jgi:putative methionine-R-sulfoxide reductase with GAF domain